MRSRRLGAVAVGEGALHQRAGGIEQLSRAVAGLLRLPGLQRFKGPGHAGDLLVSRSRRRQHIDQHREATVLDPFGNVLGVIDNPHFKLPA